VSAAAVALDAPAIARPPHGLDTGIYAPLPKRGSKAGEQIAWAFPEELTRQDAGHLARALAAMGLTRRLMTAPRCGTPLWYEARLRGDVLHRHMSAEVRRLGVVLAEMPPGGHA